MKDIKEEANKLVGTKDVCPNLSARIGAIMQETEDVFINDALAIKDILEKSISNQNSLLEKSAKLVRLAGEVAGRINPGEAVKRIANMANQSHGYVQENIAILTELLEKIND